MASYVLMWEDKKGSRNWDAIEGNKVKGFLNYLLSNGVNPATVMIAYNPMLFHWVWPQFHTHGLSDVHFQNINEEIYGDSPKKSNYKPVDVPVEPAKIEEKYGWIAPDGRFFKCKYGEHYDLAKKIVGELECVRDPEQHLENLGWAKIYKGIEEREIYSVGMGYGKKLTDSQFKTLQREGFENSYGVKVFLEEDL